MNEKTLIADPAAIELDAFVSNDDSITIIVHSVQKDARCPLCEMPSRSLHSHYIRRIADLPWHGVAVKLELHTRKFRCHNEFCKRKVFCERLPKVVSSYSRKTVRFSEVITLLAFALGGRSGSRTSCGLNLQSSKDTLLRGVRKSANSINTNQEKTNVKILGVDDFAFRKGQTYGTILVDLELHKVIDLLPNREAETFSTWLKEYPEIEVISRDRACAYRDGASSGAPQAAQVADRWHVLKNLREALENFLQRKHSVLKQAHETIKNKNRVNNKLREDLSDGVINQQSTASSLINTQQQAKAERRNERFERVKELYRQHYSISAIARTLKMHRRTVRRFLRVDEMPERKSVCRNHSLFRFVPYLEKRWSEGCQNAMQLWRELKEQGYRGSDSTVRHFLMSWREEIPVEARKESSKDISGIVRIPPSPRKAGWLLYGPEFHKK